MGRSFAAIGGACLVLAAVETAHAQALQQRIAAAAPGDGVTWVAYRVPMAGPRRMCCFDSAATRDPVCCGRCLLERGDGIVSNDPDLPVAAGSRIVIEAPTEMRVFVRVENRSVVRLRTFSLDCDVDAGGMPVVAIENVAVDESVAWLAALARSTSETASALSALALHPGTAASKALIAFARDDERPRVRSQALFWLAQRAGAEAVQTIAGALAEDPELEVKRRAVFALSRLPRGEGVPLLLDLARSHRLPEIRRQAMFWLGQSRDPRAVDFFEQILK
jgi:hypothetical protein